MTARRTGSRAGFTLMEVLIAAVDLDRVLQSVDLDALIKRLDVQAVLDGIDPYQDDRVGARALVILVGTSVRTQQEHREGLRYRRLAGHLGIDGLEHLGVHVMQALVDLALLHLGVGVHADAGHCRQHRYNEQDDEHLLADRRLLIAILVGSAVARVLATDARR